METSIKAPTLIETCPWLRDDDARIEEILKVVEINSVIEGLPPFDAETRERMRCDLMERAGREPKPGQ